MSAKNLKLIQQGLNDEHASLACSTQTVFPTSSLLALLNQQQQRLQQSFKASRYFIRTQGPSFGRCYSKGGIGMPTVFQTGRAWLRGEGSTMYTSQMQAFKDTPELMHRHLPKLKLIYIVRHPLDRIVSQWRHYRGRHPECPDFSDFMDNKKLRRLIVGCSMYYQQLSRFRQFYPEEQIQYDLRRFTQQPQKVFRSTLGFG